MGCSCSGTPKPPLKSAAPSQGGPSELTFWDNHLLAWWSLKLTFLSIHPACLLVNMLIHSPSLPAPFPPALIFVNMQVYSSAGISVSVTVVLGHFHYVSKSLRFWGCNRWPLAALAGSSPVSSCCGHFMESCDRWYSMRNSLAEHSASLTNIWRGDMVCLCVVMGEFAYLQQAA